MWNTRFHRKCLKRHYLIRVYQQPVWVRKWLNTHDDSHSALWKSNSLIQFKFNSVSILFKPPLGSFSAICNEWGMSHLEAFLKRIIIVVIIPWTTFRKAAYKWALNQTIQVLQCWPQLNNSRTATWWSFVYTVLTWSRQDAAALLARPSCTLSFRVGLMSTTLVRL